MAHPLRLWLNFLTMIQPIATDGCELWGIFGWRKNEINCIRKYLLVNSHKFEKLLTKFCKQTLGMGIQTPDLMVKGELGSYPIMGNIIKSCYGYWQHILKPNTTKYL